MDPRYGEPAFRCMPRIGVHLFLYIVLVSDPGSGYGLGPDIIPEKISGKFLKKFSEKFCKKVSHNICGYICVAGHVTDHANHACDMCA